MATTCVLPDNALATMTVEEFIRYRVQELGFDWESFPREYVTECNCCGHKPLEKIMSHDRYMLPCETWRCPRCGLRMLSPRLTVNGYRDFYVKWYRKLAAIYSNEASQDSLLRYANLVGDAAAKHLEPKRGGTLLDIGGSNGIVTAELCKRYDMTGTVLDPSPEECGEAKATGLDTINECVEDYATPQRWDVITILQSVEHLLDPLGAFKKAKAWLNVGGVFMVDWVRCEAKLDHPHQLTHQSMCCLLENAGFQMVGIYGYLRHRLYVCL